MVIIASYGSNMVIITSSDSGTGIVQQPLRRRKNPFGFAQRKLYKITVSGVSKIVQHWRVWFCATKIVQNNRQLTVTTAHLQHRDCRYSVS
jgi:hypothetical protein